MIHNSRGRLAKLWDRPEFLLLLALGLAASAFLVILKFTSEVMEGDTASLDQNILLWMRHSTEGTSPVLTTLRTMMLDFTALGNGTTLTLVVLLVTGFLLSVGHRAIALFLVVEVLLGAGLVSVMKMLVDRGRPDVVTHLTDFRSASFPSGHAANSAIVYLSLAILVIRITSGRAARLYVIAVAGFLTLAIGLSRLYLGVHWPSDVLAGWAIGSGWALIVGMVLRWSYLRNTLT